MGDNDQESGQSGSCDCCSRHETVVPWVRVVGVERAKSGGSARVLKIDPTGLYE
jgi:hypothetical protein